MCGQVLFWRCRGYVLQDLAGAETQGLQASGKLFLHGSDSFVHEKLRRKWGISRDDVDASIAKGLVPVFCIPAAAIRQCQEVVKEAFVVMNAPATEEVSRCPLKK